MLSYLYITKEGLTPLHPRYQISSVLLGNLWTVSVTLKALSSKCLFIGVEAGTEKQIIFLKITGLGSGRAGAADSQCASYSWAAPFPHTVVISSAEPPQDVV